MAYNANTNVENERKYLDSLIAKGGGTATWAKNQMKELDKVSQPQQTTQPKAVTSGMTEYIDNTGTQWRVQNGVQTNMSVPNLDQIYAQNLAQQQAQQAALLEQQKQAAEAALRAKVDQGANRLEGSKRGVDQTYSQSARQAYILNEKNKAQMPQQMAAMGISGGLAQRGIQDTSLAYQNAQNQGAMARDNQIASIDQDINNLRATGDISIAENAANYAQRLAEELSASQKRLQEQSRWQAEFDAQQAQQEASAQNTDYKNRLAMAQYLAQFGDFSGLRALGIDTSQIEAQFLAAQTPQAPQAQVQGQPKATPKAPTPQPTAAAYSDQISRLINQGYTDEEIARIVNGAGQYNTGR